MEIDIQTENSKPKFKNQSVKLTRLTDTDLQWQADRHIYTHRYKFLSAAFHPHVVQTYGYFTTSSSYETDLTAALGVSIPGHGLFFPLPWPYVNLSVRSVVFISS